MAHDINGGIDGIDHLVILVNDLDASRDLYARLGFHMTPRGTHSPHMGTGNYLFILERDYIELLGVINPTDNNAEWRAKLANGGEGLTGMALSTQDHLAAHATLKSRGMAPLDPLEFSRPVEVPGGTRDAAFAVIRVPADSTPPLNLFVCGHKTRDLVWRPEWQSHPNSAQRVVSVTLPVDDLDAAAAAWMRPFGDGSMKRENGVATIATGGHARLVLAPRTRFATLFPGLDVPPVGAITFGVGNIGDTTRSLSRNGVPHVMNAGKVMVAPAHACGVLIAFERS
jgi:catechol 2,3-dioxygenase-like lactoylglutathione lyase family enzyme